MGEVRQDGYLSTRLPVRSTSNAKHADITSDSSNFKLKLTNSLRLILVLSVKVNADMLWKLIVFNKL